MSLEKYESTIQACLTCAMRCEGSSAYCLSEHEIEVMTRCIELTKNCAAICILTSRFLAGGSEFINQTCNLCAEICDACAQECESHYMDHCKECAQACRECAEECRKVMLEYV